MGYNTTVVVINDALADIENDPLFGKKLAEAIKQKFMMKTGNADVSAGSHANAAHVVESHHADSTAVITVGGNLGIAHVTKYGWRHHEEPGQLALLTAWADQMGYDLTAKKTEQV